MGFYFYNWTQTKKNFPMDGRVDSPDGGETQNSYENNQSVNSLPSLPWLSSGTESCSSWLRLSHLSLPLLEGIFDVDFDFI